ncbi:MAG: homocysteine S-methyltransferase family protein [Acidobacteria bacterium]|nr:homocysteine S-methyltransferase family protein [Acidobacteriota bacterium]
MSPAALRDRLRPGAPALLADGAMGTMLIARGLEPGTAPESWNLSRPAVLEEIARAYREAGADIVTANTFGGSPLRLAMYGLAEHTAEINAAAVAAARRGAPGALVAADVGPTGHLLEPYGDAKPADVLGGYERQVGALASAGIDLLLLETFTDLAEALLALRAAHAAAPGVPVAVTLTFERTRRGYFTIMGTSVPAAAAQLERAGADAVGSNCGNGIDVMVEIAREFRGASALPLVFQPNAGLPQGTGPAAHPETPESMAARVPDLLEAGAIIVGGCCGTTPAHIRAFRSRLSA